MKLIDRGNSFNAVLWRWEACRRKLQVKDFCLKKIHNHSVSFLLVLISSEIMKLGEKVRENLNKFKSEKESILAIQVILFDLE